MFPIPALRRGAGHFLELGHQQSLGEYVEDSKQSVEPLKTEERGHGYLEFMMNLWFDDGKERALGHCLENVLSLSPRSW